MLACDKLTARSWVAPMTHPRTLASSVASRSLSSLARLLILRPPAGALRAAARTKMSDPSSENQERDQLESVFKQKKILRTRVRRALKSMDPLQRSQEGTRISLVSADFVLLLVGIACSWWWVLHMKRLCLCNVWNGMCALLDFLLVSFGFGPFFVWLSNGATFCGMWSFFMKELKWKRGAKAVT